MPIKNLLNIKKNKLSIIDGPYKKGKKYYWKAQCECGNFKIVDGNSFNAGRIKTCGCSHIIHGHKSPYIGCIFNNIKITKYIKRAKTIGKNVYRTGHIYEYKCLLCNYIGKKQDNYIKTTGCKNCLNKGLEEYNFPIWFVRRIKNTIKRKKITFNLSYEYLYLLYKKQQNICALSGLKINLVDRWKDYKNNTASLDRIDSSKGYIEGNVQFVHKDINFMKQSLSQKDFIYYCQKIAKYNKGK